MKITLLIIILLSTSAFTSRYDNTTNHLEQQNNKEVNND